MPIIKAFLSHKAIDGELAKEVSDALSEALPFAEFFLCEEIRKGKDFRSDIWEELTKAKFFVFLYTGPLEDWSWCCFEAGAYKSKMSRPLYCLHAGGFNRHLRFQICKAPREKLATSCVGWRTLVKHSDGG